MPGSQPPAAKTSRLPGKKDPRLNGEPRVLSLQPQCDALSIGQAIFFQHIFQYLHVGGNVQRVILEQLIQLLFKPGHHLVHHPLDAGLRRGDILSLDSLGLQLSIGPEYFQRRRQIIV